MVICLERGADLHTAQLMPVLLAVCCFSKIQIGFTFLVPADRGSPGQRVVKRVCVCVVRLTLSYPALQHWAGAGGGSLSDTATRLFVRPSVRLSVCPMPVAQNGAFRAVVTIEH